MDFLKKAASQFAESEQGKQGNAASTGQAPVQQPVAEGSNNGGGNFLGGLGDKLNAAAGGGPESEKNEDYLDKGIDFVQEKFLHQGPQNNESAVEQAKDEQIASFIRSKYKDVSGKEFPIADKKPSFP